MPELITGAGSGTGAGTGAGAAGAGAGPVDTGTPGTGGEAAPVKVSFSFDEGGESTEFSLGDDGDGGAPAGAGEFKFEQLDPLREGEHAELYKTLKSELSAKSRFAKHFKNPEELAQHVDKVNRLAEFVGKRADGKVGIDAVEATVRELGDMLGNLQNGDPGLVDKWFKDNPAGMVQMTQHALTNLQKTDPKLHAAIIGKGGTDFLSQKDASGQSAIDALNAAYAKLPADQVEAKKLLERVAHSINEMFSQGAYKPDQGNIVERQKVELAKRETSVWNKETDIQADDILRPAAGKALSALLNTLKKDATAEERAEFRATLMKEFWKEAGKDRMFVQRLNELRKNQDRAGILQLIKENRGKFLPLAAKSLYRQKLVNAERASAKAEGASKQEGAAGSVTPKQAAVRYTGKVHPEKGPMVDMDFARMSSEGIEAMDRKFYIKGRKELFTW